MKRLIKLLLVPFKISGFAFLSVAIFLCYVFVMLINIPLLLLTER